MELIFWLVIAIVIVKVVQRSNNRLSHQSDDYQRGYWDGVRDAQAGRARIEGSDSQAKLITLIRHHDWPGVCRCRRSNPIIRVFNDITAAWRQLNGFGSTQKNIRRRFGTRDHITADNDIKITVDARVRQFPLC